MDTIVEEIALTPLLTQNQDDKKKFHRNSEDIQNQRDVIIRTFNSKNSFKAFIIWILLFICLIVLAGPVYFHISYRLPSIKLRNVANDLFSEERARDYLINLTAYGSRVSHTRGNLDTRDFIVSQLECISLMSKRNLQFEIDLQNFTDSNHNQLQNILIRVSNPTKTSENISSLLLTAHYDSVEFSPGSCDDGSGVVIILELFSNLINDLSISFLNVELIILFTNGEEMGPEGVLAFLHNHHWRLNILRFIYIDAISCNEKGSLIQMTSSQLIIDYSRVLRTSANVIVENIPRWVGTTSDYDIYSTNASLLGYNFGFFLDGYKYHTSFDEVLFIKEGVIQDLGENLGILIRYILSGDFEKIENFIDHDPWIYFDIFGRYLIVYRISTSRIVQQILIILIIVIGIILILIDEIYHRKRSIVCSDCRCIYYCFKYSFLLRIISIMIYFISNLISGLIGLLFSAVIGWFISIIRPLSWFGNSTLTIFLFSFPCLIGFIIISYLWNIFHHYLLQKWPHKSFRLNSTKQIHFNFEQNFSILLIYVVLMFISIYSDHRILYIILVWSIFLCPIYLLLIIIEYFIHWKEINWNIFKKRSYWFYIPLFICLFPFSHTIEIMNRLIRILIPFMSRGFSVGSFIRGNMIISSIIAIPNVFLMLIFIPILQRTKQFGRILFILCIGFLITILISYNRQPFTSNHPKIFYAKQTSKSIYTAMKLTNVSFIVPVVSQTSLITVLTFDNLPLSPILDDFQGKSGHILHNKRCFSSKKCTFNNTFNHTNAVEDIHIEFLNNSSYDLRIVFQHVLSYNIQISSSSFVEYFVVNQLIIPRTETMIDIRLNSKLSLFDINLTIKRCDLIDSPFLLLFTHLMPNMLLTGSGQCQTINDLTTLIIDLKYILSNRSKN